MLRDFSDARESCLKSPRHVNQSIWWGSLLSRIKDFYSLFSVLRLTKTGRHKILKAWKLFLITPVFSMHTRAKRFIPHFRFLPYTILWSARVKTGSKLKSAHTIDHTENCRECRGNAFDPFFPLMTLKGYGTLFCQPDVNILPFLLDIIDLLPPAKEMLSLWFR